jgi:hypothetical protein
LRRAWGRACSMSLVHCQGHEFTNRAFIINRAVAFVLKFLSGQEPGGVQRQSLKLPYTGSATPSTHCWRRMERMSKPCRALTTRQQPDRAGYLHPSRELDQARRAEQGCKDDGARRGHKRLWEEGQFCSITSLLCPYCARICLSL